MGRHYDETVMPDELRRSYDVYDRIDSLGIDLGSFDEDVVSLAEPHPVKAFVPYAGAVLHESGLVYLSGQGGGQRPMDDASDPAIDAGRLGAQKAADDLIRRLHWTLSCGGEGDLNDVLYTVSALALVVSPGGGAFGKAPQVVNGFSYRWQSVFGGVFSDYAVDGVDPGGLSGMHARMAMGGADGASSIGADMVVAIPPPLAVEIIRRRGWYFPLPPGILHKIQAERSSDAS